MRISMKHLTLSILLSCSLLVAGSPTFAKKVQKDDPKARAIMQKVEDRDDGDNQENDMIMILIDKNGKERIRKIHSFSKDFGEDTHRMMFFLHPPDVKDTGFLTYDYDDESKDDDQWLYLPALRKTKRIASDDKSSSFMGSDLNYADMTSRDLEDYDFTLLKEQKDNGHKVWLIQALPRRPEVIDETGYKKSIVFVRQDNYFVVKAVHWVRDGGYLKYFDVKKLQQIDGIWIATETHITKKKGKKTEHKTILKLDNVVFKDTMDKGIFTVRRLEKGV
ncbi:MAG: outer membrane lipoprotein-sorting protein [Candidatus Electrothrix sp. AS4_5]|nr:outer membrane lipoprotein-sorting protein [Candidatus Electrothrix sp. AX1]MCI5182517.1 outer membrane lipoprotein-sorting protein [Candidatus Electrothrix gigas]MCI5189701.1 outer membrane lipoprotein-sorting protein [Candidatus Electrothrix gigas]MCI5226154.1 outer membrane lipoprotein-sorting protein [Candidatus Electrothrix gigas]